MSIAGSTRGRLLFALVVSVLGSTGCRGDESPRGPEPTPMTADRAQQVLTEEGPAGEGRFRGGTFRFGGPFDNSEMRTDGRLASASWDIYWHRDHGDRGAWGVGIDVLETPERAARALDEEAAFWCPGPRRPVRGLGDGGVDDVRTSSCRRAGGEDFYATLDALDGSVLASLTVAGPTRRAATAALQAVWPAIRGALLRAHAALN